MRLVRIDWIQDGMELARDIPSAAIGAAPLLRRGVRLSSSLATRLSSLGIRALWIEDDMGEGIIPAMPLPDHIRAATEEAVAACFEAARAVAADLSELPFHTLKQIEHAADSLIDALADAPEAALAFDDRRPAAAESLAGKGTAITIRSNGRDVRRSSRRGSRCAAVGVGQLLTAPGISSSKLGHPQSLANLSSERYRGGLQRRQT